ncbi:hypothetical protein PENSPDRAFT_695282 [Peniophora sp. CONT]|nr:hypothetical protein PENSPDRAFT_695282 [Peniophora sp. CONT]
MFRDTPDDGSLSDERVQSTGTSEAGEADSASANTEDQARASKSHGILVANDLVKGFEQVAALIHHLALLLQHPSEEAENPASHPLENDTTQAMGKQGPRLIGTVKTVKKADHGPFSAGQTPGFKVTAGEKAREKAKEKAKARPESSATKHSSSHLQSVLESTITIFPLLQHPQPSLIPLPISTAVPTTQPHQPPHHEQDYSSSQYSHYGQYYNSQYSQSQQPRSSFPPLQPLNSQLPMYYKQPTHHYQPPLPQSHPLHVQQQPMLPLPFEQGQLKYTYY